MTAQPGPARRFPITESGTPPACPGAVVRFDAGRETALLCPDEAARQGLTIIDLGDEWTPTLFAGTAGGQAPAFRTQYLALAAGHDAEGDEPGDIAKPGELLGVVPSLAVVRERLTDDARHGCHARVDSAPIRLIDQPYAQEYAQILEGADRARAVLAMRLERERAARRLRGLAAVSAIPELASAYQQWKKLDDVHRGIVAVQRHLVCEGLLPVSEADGSMTPRMVDAVGVFQRRNSLMPSERLDAETLEAFARDSREHDFRLALRILRERIADAMGLIEDGTAGDGPRPVLGRMLDPAVMRAPRGSDRPLPEGAGDLVSPATEAAARQLGWTSPGAVRGFLEHHRAGVRVALALPDPPAYHTAHMDLSAELDRGDVWYDEPPVARHVEHRPALILYVNDHGTKRPLIRWATTIGGWSEVRTASGEVEQRWKESPVGPRIWRRLYAAPTWLPPGTTPDRDLVKNLGEDRWGLKTEVFGPGPHGAFGMMLLLHDGAPPAEADIGTHGSASIGSILDGTSHGCHRLFSQLAVRLGDFLLHHRHHVVKGDQPVHYHRIVHDHGTFVARVDSLGFLYELTPPIPINVLKGNILSPRKVPPRASAPARRSGPLREQRVQVDHPGVPGARRPAVEASR
ncbi:MAG TPA: hypothetical protein VFT22_35715 [Kofleriaceae bacterium]|nr:hypothetical protein [Kofleriaceae bacterium]